jgi:uncharacterized membrane-anchored protein
MNKRVFIAIGLFWLLIILGFVAFKEFTLRNGEDVLLKTRPVDPRDLFRGDYIILNYDISTLDISTLNTDSQNFEENDNVFVSLNNEGNYGIPTGVHKSAPKEGLFLKGKIKNVNSNTLSIEYGIESYFVPEGKGWEIQRQSGSNLEVRVAIDKLGNAVIKELLVDGNVVDFES